MQKIHITITLDKRRMKKNGKYPLKLQVFQPNPRKQKLYPTIFEFTEKEFKGVWKSLKIREEYKVTKKKLDALLVSAEAVVSSLPYFSFNAFEEKFFKESSIDHRNVFNVFDEVEKQKLLAGAISTAEKYRLAKVSLQNFLKYRDNINEDSTEELTLFFEEIDKDFLLLYQNYAENVKGISAATIGIYLRNLRAIYKIGIKKGVANQVMYPFLKGGYQIPSSSKINKALTEEQLKKLWHSKPESTQQEIAKDFWFFSYFSFGMNTRDICELKHSSLGTDYFKYIRSKTKNTSKVRTEKLVHLTKSLLEIIERRRDNSSSFLFGILNDKDTAKQKHEKVRNFNKFINIHFRKFAASSGIDEVLANEIGTYHARHSFATVSILKGKSVALISEILHDGNLKVTQNYINSFPNEAFKELGNELEF